MSNRPYVLVSGVLFGVVAILHLIRAVNGWPLVMGPWSVPLWVSWGGTVVPGFLGIWAFKLAARS